MRTFLAAASLVCLALLLATSSNFAQDKKKAEAKEVTLKGKICCNKCELMKSTACETVIVVKDEKSKKETVYLFDKASHTKFHDDICTGAKNGSVVGTVKDDGKKKLISVTKVTYE